MLPYLQIHKFKKSLQLQFNLTFYLTLYKHFINVFKGIWP